MSKVYDKAFKVGAGINLLLFLILNIGSYDISYAEYLNARNSHQGGSLDSFGAYSWGFPFKMGRLVNYTDLDLPGVIGNTVVVVLCSFILGFIIKSTWAETTSRPNK